MWKYFFSTFILIVVVYFVRYGMRYVAMSLRVALTEKFPDAAESEILKVSWVTYYACLIPRYSM